MNIKTFEAKYKELIPHANMEELHNLFETQKKSYSGGKIRLFIKKFQDKFTKEKSGQFLELGYNEFYTYEFTTLFLDEAIKYERTDMVEYMFDNHYVSPIVESFYLGKVLSSEKVLKELLDKHKIKEKITPEVLSELLIKCAKFNLSNQFDMIYKLNKDKIKDITKEQQKNLFFTSAQSSFPILKKLFRSKEFSFDINHNEYSYGIGDERKNLLLIAASENNIEMMRYLLTSPELEKHSELADSIYFIFRMEKGKELLDTIIFDIKAKLTQQLEELLKNDDLLEVFKKRDLMLKIDQNLEPKGNKIKPKKI